MLNVVPHELTACPACSAGAVEHLDHISEKHRAAFVSGCNRCGLVFVNPPPSRSEIAARYQSGGSWEQKQANKAAKPRKADAGVMSAARQLRQRCGLNIVLDFGCGQGDILDALQDEGWRTTGIDPANASSTTCGKSRSFMRAVISPLRRVRSATIAAMRDVIDVVREHGRDQPDRH